MTEQPETKWGREALVRLMETLAEGRPVFHNEADLQHAFAWQLHTSRPDASTRRYDVIKDVARLEQIVAAGAADAGYAIVLTNDSSYWREWEPAEVADAAFRIHHGRVFTGPAAWGARAGAGTRKGRDRPIDIRGSYTIEWRDYSTVAPTAGGTFRYMVVGVARVDPHDAH